MNSATSFLTKHIDNKHTLLADINITPRELEVLHLIAYEFSAKEIASRLYVSYETVSSHRQNLKRKMNVKNTAGMVRVAYERGLLLTL